MASLTSTLVMVIVLLIQIIFSNTKVFGDEHQQESCSRMCGVHNITHPFRLNDSPENCGDKDYTLSCEDNYKLILYYDSGEHHGKYYVQSINYNNFTIRLLDFNLRSNNSIPPYYSLGFYNFSSYSASPYLFNPFENYSFTNKTKSMLYVSCRNPAEHSSSYMYGANCMNSVSHSQYQSSFYVDGYDKTLSQLGLRDTCRIERMFLTSWPAEAGNNSHISCNDIRRMMFYGFELSWINSLCKDVWYVDLGLNYSGCVPPDKVPLSSEIGYLSLGIGEVVFAFFSIVKFVLGAPCIIALLIYKCRRKHLSMYDDIEDFLSRDNNIMPIRYSFKDIKSITKQFKTKLGSGGYGSVFKGQLRSGRLVAVKLLDKGKANGQDFVNEVATIGRIHHVNVVQLIGFCVEGSKRVLIYEFMSNGSLDKYIFSNFEENCSLSCEKLFSISLGVARGIEYLHNGCIMKILHFDIKPHNILLDENFNPKVSDFGLARLCSTETSIVPLTAARGTIGYMAPELFYRNVGTISYKADVYSYGMLLMEMASRRRNLNALVEKSSQLYFPFWVYDQLHDGREVTIENDTNQEIKLAKKMMIVALWCIQTKPSDRPSMKEVIEMLEEEDVDLQMPNKPYFTAQDLSTEDVRDGNTSVSYSCSSASIMDSEEPT